MTTQLLTAIAMSLVTVAVMSARKVPFTPLVSSAGFSGVMGYVYWQYCLPGMVVVLIGGYLLLVPGCFRRLKSGEPAIINAANNQDDIIDVEWERVET